MSQQQENESATSVCLKQYYSQACRALYQPQVSRQMSVGHVYPLSRLIVHHLLTDSCRKLSMKRNFFLMIIFFIYLSIFFISLFTFLLFSTKYFKLINFSFFFLLKQKFPKPKLLKFPIFQSCQLLSNCLVFCLNPSLSLY